MQSRPWYRSRLFWLGLSGLVFLLWVWADSLINVSVMGSRTKLWGQGRYAETGAPELFVQQGMVLFDWGRVVDVSPEIVVNKKPLGFARLKGTVPSWRKEEDGLFSFESVVRRLEVSPGHVSLKTLRCWFQVWSVVLGYAVTWLGAMIAWQWRKDRMIKASTMIDQDSAV